MCKGWVASEEVSKSLYNHLKDATCISEVCTANPEHLKEHGKVAARPKVCNSAVNIAVT